MNVYAIFASSSNQPMQSALVSGATGGACSPTSVANSDYSLANSITGSYSGASVFVTCNFGFSGSGFAICGTSGVFSIPSCSAADCTTPNQNGYIFSGGSSAYGSTRTATCASNYSGTPTSITCQSGGWTLSEGCARAYAHAMQLAPGVTLEYSARGDQVAFSLRVPGDVWAGLGSGSAMSAAEIVLGSSVLAVEQYSSTSYSTPQASSRRGDAELSDTAVLYDPSADSTVLSFTWVCIQPESTALGPACNALNSFVWAYGQSPSLGSHTSDSRGVVDLTLGNLTDLTTASSGSFSGLALACGSDGDCGGQPCVAGVCQCVGALGSRCEVELGFLSPFCLDDFAGNPAVCMSSAVADGYVYMRLESLSSQGWVAMIYDSSNTNRMLDGEQRSHSTRISYCDQT